MKRLYIVSTYYHALISCIKQLTEPCDADILVTGYIPDGHSLYERIKDAGIFGNAFWDNNMDEYQAENKLDYILNLHRKNAAAVEKGLPVSMSEYDDIHIFHEDTRFAHYLKDKKIRYHLNEDALDSYKSISRSAFYYMLPKKNPKFFVKKIFRIGYVFCGYDYCAEVIEVNDGSDLEIAEFAKDKLLVVPRKALFDKLTENDIGILRTIFAKDIPDMDYTRCVLLLTQPLFADGIVKSAEEQRDIYLKLAAENTPNGEQLVIKPHPRDTADYSQMFPDAVIIDKNMPAEMLKYICPDGFKNIVNINSCMAIY